MVTVDNNGLITGVGLGSAIVTAISEDGGKTSSCTVTVSPTKVTAITLTPSIFSLVAGNLISLTPAIVPGDAVNQAVLWTSSNPAVATVSNGVVTGVKASTTAVKISATTLDGGFTASSLITVTADPNKIPVTKVALNYHTKTLTVNGTTTLLPTVSPTTATNQNILWKSSDNTRVMVDASGNITGINPGQAVITAYSEQDNSIQDTCTVTVTAASIPVSSISLNQSSYTLPIGSIYKLVSTISPSSATNKNVTWQCVKFSPLTGQYVADTSGVATVDNNGNVAGLKVGTITVRATSVSDTNVSSSLCTITVIPVSVTNLSLDKYTDSLFVGNSDNIVATVNPTNATNQQVTWTSSRPDLLYVDPNTGSITGLGVGQSIITAISTDGSNKTAYCTVSVLSNPYKVTSIKLTPSGLTAGTVLGSGTNNVTGNLTVGCTATIAATVIPNTATNQNVIWTCTNTDVIAFNYSSSTITIIGKSSGTSTITATSASDGTIIGNCTVTIP